MSAHTPGPWTLGSRVISADTHDTFNVAVALLSSAREAPELSEDERAANGRLIAAAPDLLEALEEMVDAVGFGSEDPSVERARAAVVKARGGK